MSDAKDNIVTIRLSNEEKALIEQEAKLHSLSLSQYVRYKILELQETTQQAVSQTAPSIKFLDEHLPLLARVLLDGYFHIIKIAERALPPEAIEEAENDALEVINRLGIAKPDAD
jgi:Family of unknown function (DUF6290)